MIDRPIFIVGPHRSGTTLLYRILAQHPDIGYFNRFNKRLPAWPRLAKLLSLFSGKDVPMESQSIWDRFKKSDTDIMDETDAKPEVRDWYRNLISTVLQLRRAKRFLAKYPRLSLRLPWLNAIFPDAFFIHMKRDWRAVVNSTVQRKKKRNKRNGGWFGVYIPGWQELDRMISYEESATKIFVTVTRELECLKERFGHRFVEVSYENLCHDPIITLHELTKRIELSWSEAFKLTIPKKLKNANYKWQKQLDLQVLDRLRKNDPVFFKRYEFSETRHCK